MKVVRRWTELAMPFRNIAFGPRRVALNQRGTTPQEIVAPLDWSQTAIDILASKYMRRAGVPSHTTPVREANVPEWLWARTPAENATFGGETGANQVFMRLAGCWTYWGWKLGYFHAEDDAKAYHDEMAYLLATQRFAPASPQWFNTGLNWAYGIDGPDAGQWATDFDYIDGPHGRKVYDEPGRVAPVTAAYTRPAPSACFILKVDDSLLGPNSIYATLESEARVFKFGGGAGANFSALRGTAEPLSGGGVSSGPLSFLKVLDAGGGAIKSGGVTRRAAKMVILNIDHPDIKAFIGWKAKEEFKVASLAVGSEVLHGLGYRPDLQPAGRAGAGTFTQAMTVEDVGVLHDLVPDGIVRRADLAAREGVAPVWPDDPFTVGYEGEGYETVGGQNANNSVRIPNEFFRRLDDGGMWELKKRTGGVAETVRAADLWDLLTRAAWTCADPGVQYDTTVNEWNPCPAAGRINATNPCSEYHWLDDTACNLGSLRLTKFAVRDGRGAVVGLHAGDFEYAARLATVTLDITVSMAAYPTQSIAHNSWRFRTLGLGYADLGAYLMQAGLAYDSPAGVAWCAAITSLMHSTAMHTSADLADDLSPFPEYDANRPHVVRVMENHAAFAQHIAGKPYRYAGLSVEPATVDGGLLPDALRERVATLASEAVEHVRVVGLRNAQVTLLAPTGTIGLSLDCDTTGVEPDYSLVKDKKLAGGGYLKIVNRSLPAGLAALGYCDDDVKDVLDYVFGTRRFPKDDEPGHTAMMLTRDVLLGFGLTHQELHWIEDRMKAGSSLEDAARAGVPASRWAELLGIGIDGLTDTYQPLAAVAFRNGYQGRDLDVAVSNTQLFAFGTGTVEGSPKLRPEHYAVFDCATPSGLGSRSIPADGHIRMMAAAQPSLSGGISKTINLPWDASAADVSRVYRYAHQLMCKSVSLYADGAKLNQPLTGASIRRPDRVLRAASQVAGWRTVADPAGPLVYGPGVKPGEPMAAGTGHPAGSGGDARHERSKREHLPNRRPGVTQKLKLGGQTMYLRTGEYPDGRLGEIFIDATAEGSTFRAITNALAVSVSLGLQHGVPLEEYVDAFVGTRFEPNGVLQGHDRLKMASSFLDAMFRDLAIHYLHRDELAHIQTENDGPLESRLADDDPTGGLIELSEEYAVSDLAQAVGAAGGPGAQSVAAVPAVVPQVRTEHDRAATNARQSGYTGEMCRRCSGFMVQKIGPCTRCLSCGESSGCG